MTNKFMNEEYVRKPEIKPKVFDGVNGDNDAGNHDCINITADEIKNDMICGHLQDDQSPADAKELMQEMQGSKRLPLCTANGECMQKIITKS